MSIPFFDAVTRVMDLLQRDVSAYRLRDNPAQFRRRDSRVFIEVVSDEVFDERGRRCQLEPRAGVRDVEDETEDAVFSRTEPHLERTAVVWAVDVKALGVAPGDCRASCPPTPLHGQTVRRPSLRRTWCQPVPLNLM